jgi:hypothetical protein
MMSLGIVGLEFTYVAHFSNGFLPPGFQIMLGFKF